MSSRFLDRRPASSNATFVADAVNGVVAGSSAATRAQLIEHLRSLGVREGGALLVHTSYRAVRPVDGGPAGLNEALLDAVGRKGTVVMPSWGDDDETPFDPRSTPAAADLGVTAGLFWRHPDARRGDHPFAFAAVGRQAEEITADPLPLPPHRYDSPVGRVHQLGGQILLLGVGHDANTTIHLAEVMACVPYGVPKHCTVMRDGRAVRLDYRENDHCCERFALVDDWMRDQELQREGNVGNAHARLVESRDLVRVVSERLAGDPLIFLHPYESGCGECDEARLSLL